MVFKFLVNRIKVTTFKTSIREVQDTKKMIAVSHKKKWREYWK
ncbi:DUF3967 domain-containing protein [Peribacillus butanolivorans]